MGRVGNLVEVPYKELPESYKKYIRIIRASERGDIHISFMLGNSRIRLIDGAIHILIPSEKIPFWKLKEFGGYL